MYFELLLLCPIDIYIWNVMAWKFVFEYLIKGISYTACGWIINRHNPLISIYYLLNKKSIELYWSKAFKSTIEKIENLYFLTKRHKWVHNITQRNTRTAHAWDKIKRQSGFNCHYPCVVSHPASYIHSFFFISHTIWIYLYYKFYKSVLISFYILVFLIQMVGFSFWKKNYFYNSINIL